MALRRARRKIKLELDKEQSVEAGALAPRTYATYASSLLRIRLNESELRILLFLRLQASEAEWTPPISLDHIQQSIGKSRSAVTGAIKRLKEDGLLETKKEFSGASAYKILPASNSADICNNTE